MTRHTDVVIIGAGISGLASARSLSSLGIESIVLEKSSRVGGLIQTSDEDGYVTDHAASMVLNFSAKVSDFLLLTGLDHLRVERKEINRRYIIKNNQLCAVPNTITGMMLGGLFSTRTRMKLMAEPFIPASKDDNESVADFIRRRVGQQVLDLAIDPYVSAVLGCDPEKACARSTLPRLKILEQTFGSFSAGILLKRILPGHKGVPQQAFSFRGGMQTLTDSLAADKGVEIKTDQHIEQVQKLKRGWQVTARQGDQLLQIHARHLIFTTPADVSAHLIKRVQPDTASLLNKIQYAPISQIHLGFDRQAFKHPLDGNGFLTPSKSSIALRGSLWMSNLIDGRAPDGKVLTSNFIGGATQLNSIQFSDQKLTDLALLSLRQLCGLQQPPEMVRINRHTRGLPLYHGHYFELGKAIENSLQSAPGLHLVANYLHGISIRDRILQASSVAQKIHTQLQSQANQSLSHQPRLVLR